MGRVAPTFPLQRRRRHRDGKDLGGATGEVGKVERVGKLETPDVLGTSVGAREERLDRGGRHDAGCVLGGDEGDDSPVVRLA